MYCSSRILEKGNDMNSVRNFMINGFVQNCRPSEFSNSGSQGGAYTGAFHWVITP